MKDRTNIIIVPIVQIVFYFLAYEISNYLAHIMGLVYSRGVAWGISSNGFVVKYIVVVILLAVLNSVFEKRVLLFSIIGSIVYGFIVFPILEDYPYRGSLVILIGVIGIFIGCLFFSKLYLHPQSQ